MQVNNSAHRSNAVDYTGGTPAPKKSGGCGCFLVGCLILIILFLAPIIGGGIYIASLDDEEWGSKIVSIISNPTYSTEIKKAIENNSEIDPAQRQAFTSLYDKFLDDYNKLPPEKQKIINKNVFIVIKKALSEPEKFDKNPPQEFLDIIQALDLGADISNLKNTINNNQQNTMPPDNGKTNSQQNNTYKTEYDF